MVLGCSFLSTVNSDWYFWKLWVLKDSNPWSLNRRWRTSLETDGSNPTGSSRFKWMSEQPSTYKWPIRCMTTTLLLITGEALSTLSTSEQIFIHFYGLYNRWRVWKPLSVMLTGKSIHVYLPNYGMHRSWWKLSWASLVQGLILKEDRKSEAWEDGPLGASNAVIVPCVI